MSKIRFRVFNTSAKSYIKNDSFFEKFGVFGPLNTLTNSFSGENLIFELSTNLKDINNKEIYENDLVQNQAGREFLVEWVHLGFKFREKIKNKFVDCPVEHIGDIKLCRIIGNNHE